MDREEPKARNTKSNEDLAHKRVFTTGEAAAVCKVSQQTIIRCFDAGRLTGFRVPGSKFRRIPRDELIRFMKANGIPLEALNGVERRRVLAVDDDEQILALYKDVLSRDDRYELRTAANAYDAGLLTESFRPGLILLDFMLPDLRGDVVCARVRENPAYEGMKVLGVSGVPDERQLRTMTAAGADGILRKPFTVAELLDAMEQLLAEPAEDESSAGGNGRH